LAGINSPVICSGRFEKKFNEVFLIRGRQDNCFL